MSGILGIATLCVVGVAGCASREVADGFELPAKNRAQWALPLDEYVSPNPDPESTAERLLVQPCMRERGYEWAASAAEFRARPGESWNSAHRKLFSVDLAREYGYGNSAELDLPVPVLDELRDIDVANTKLGTSSPEADEAFTACWSLASKRVGSPKDGSPYDLAMQLASAAFEKSLVTKPVQRAVVRWRQCMAPAGVSDLAESPDLMPPSSISKLRPAVDAPTPNGEETNIDPEERRVAVADAECQESSGYAEAAYQAEWDEEVGALAENADELQRYAAQAAAINRRAEQAIAEYVPTTR